jgi:hypothetical protein
MTTRSKNAAVGRGQRNDARVTALLADNQLSNQQIADALHMSRDSAIIYTRRLRDCTPKRIYLSGWLHAPKGKPAPMFTAGDLPDVEYVTTRKRKLPDRVQVQIERVKAALAEPMTANQLAVAISRCISRTHKYLRMLRDDKLVYVMDHAAPDGRGDQAPIYALGNLPDAVKHRQTRAERHQKEQAKPGQKFQRSAARRAKYRKAMGLPPPAPANPFAALFNQSKEGAAC